MPPGRPRRRNLQAILAALAALAALGLVACEPPPPASPPAEVILTGHGFGHGRGLGQYGALGYAIDHRWPAGQILDHFYGGTTAGRLPGNPVQRVFLQGRTNRELIVVQERGELLTSVEGYSRGHRAIRVQPVGGDRWQVYFGSTCDGPWLAWGPPRAVDEVGVRPAVAGSNDRSRMLALCGATGRRYYRGDLLALRADGGTQTVNRVDTESYLRSVLPSEVPASWADLGGGRGFEAVRAQAVAARSYVSAGDTRFEPWATTCDSQQCQVYKGVAYRSDDGSLTPHEDYRTDFAAAISAGEIRRRPDGRTARTEFSSSTGGWSAGGDFPAVLDEGDDTASNRNHNWTATLTDDTIEAAFDRRQGGDMGDLLDLRVTARNGLGADGGRVLTVDARFSGGAVTLTGNQLRSLFGLRSDWFVANFR